MNRLENIKIKKLRAFMDMAEGSDSCITMNISYRTKHRYVKEVENLYGYKLFEGIHRPSNLTYEGKILLKVVKEIVKNIDVIDNLYFSKRE